jgi:hypothetical protein
MPSACAKVVDYMGTQRGISRAFISTEGVETDFRPPTVSVKARLITTLIPLFPLHLSPAKVPNPPLIEHTFYPVSTAPINNCNQMKIKER